MKSLLNKVIKQLLQLNFLGVACDIKGLTINKSQRAEISRLGSNTISILWDGDQIVLSVNVSFDRSVMKCKTPLSGVSVAPSGVDGGKILQCFHIITPHYNLQ